jgi:hypothetical protein
MAAFILDSLVLRGVTVLCDGQAVELRRGSSDPAGGSTPEVCISMRNPSLGWRTGFNAPAKRYHQAVDLDGVAQAAQGAGRSHGQVRVSCSRGAATFAARAVSLTAHLSGGEELPIAIALAARTAKVTALGSETSSAHDPITRLTRMFETGSTGSVMSGKRRGTGKYGRTPPARIPPASTRETGCR